MNFEEIIASVNPILTYHSDGTWGECQDPVTWPDDPCNEHEEFMLRAKHGYSGDGTCRPSKDSDCGWNYRIWEGKNGSFIVTVSSDSRSTDIYTAGLPAFLALIDLLQRTVVPLSVQETDSHANASGS